MLSRGCFAPTRAWYVWGTALTDTEAGVNVATHDRRVGLLLQDPLLFPHLSVAKNVAFGPQCRRGMFGSGRARTRASALRWLREVNAEQFADRKPRQLSGAKPSASPSRERWRPNQMCCCSTSR